MQVRVTSFESMYGAYRLAVPVISIFSFIATATGTYGLAAAIMNFYVAVVIVMSACDLSAASWGANCVKAANMSEYDTYYRVAASWSVNCVTTDITRGYGVYDLAFIVTRTCNFVVAVADR